MISIHDYRKTDSHDLHFQMKYNCINTKKKSTTEIIDTFSYSLPVKIRSASFQMAFKDDNVCVNCWVATTTLAQSSLAPSLISIMLFNDCTYNLFSQKEKEEEEEEAEEGKHA